MNEQKTAPVQQRTPLNIVTTEQFLSCLHREVHAQHGFVDEPEEVLSQLLSLIRLISSSVNEKGKGFSVNVEDIDWALLLAMDLIKEVDKRLEQERAYQKTESEELERQLNICHLIPTGPDTWFICTEDEEVAP